MCKGPNIFLQHCKFPCTDSLYYKFLLKCFLLLPAVIVQAISVKATNICMMTWEEAQCLFMKENIQCSKACMHIGIGPFVKPGELIISYCVILFFEPCISFCNIKTHVAEAAQMVSMSMNALENFGRGRCIRTPQGDQHAAPLLVCHSSSCAKAERAPVGSDAFSQLGRLMNVIWFHT